MFNQLRAHRVLRASALVPAPVTVPTGASVDQTASGLAVVCVTTGRTLGTCYAQVVTSFDGGATWVDLPVAAGTLINANGLATIILAGAVPLLVAVKLTPIGGFDGSVQVDLRSDATHLVA